MWQVKPTEGTPQQLLAKLTAAGHTAYVQNGEVYFSPFEPVGDTEAWRDSMRKHFKLEFV